jgi:Putative beta-lactamase-inhibitor-like, PepSY-like
MKSLLSASALILVCSSGVLAQEQKISCDALPPAVRAAFEKAFAKATIADCVKDVENRKTTYEINSTEGETRRHVRFYADGRVVEVEEPIGIGSVPEPAKQAVSKKYPKGEITLVEKVTRDEQVLYEFRVKQGKRTVQIGFDANGKQVKSKEQ